MDLKSTWNSNRNREKERGDSLDCRSKNLSPNSFLISLNLVPYLSWNFIPLFASFDPNEFVGFRFAICDWDEVVCLLGEKLKVK